MATEFIQRIVIDGPAGEEMEDQFDPLSDAERGVFDATFNFWNRIAPRRRLPQRPQSWDAPTVRALDDERVYALEG